MTCSSCEQKVKAQLLSVPEVTGVEIDLGKGTAAVTMSRHIATTSLQAALKDYPKYQLTEVETSGDKQVVNEPQRGWLNTYKPILLVFAFITGITLLVQARQGNFNRFPWEGCFYGEVFLVFFFM